MVGNRTELAGRREGGTAPSPEASLLDGVQERAGPSPLHAAPRRHPVAIEVVIESHGAVASVTGQQPREPIGVAERRPTAQSRYTREVLVTVVS